MQHLNLYFYICELWIQSLWTRLSSPWKLGDGCVQPPVQTLPRRQWDGTGVKAHSTASAAGISALCCYRVKDTISPSNFIPKPEFSNLSLSKRILSAWRLQHRQGCGRVSAVPACAGPCWVLQPGMAHWAAGGSQRHRTASGLMLKTLSLHLYALKHWTKWNYLW